MKSSTVRLSHKLRLSKLDDAKAYQLDRSYENYLSEIKYISERRGITSSSTIPAHLVDEIDTVLKKSTLNGFLQNIKLLKPFVDVDGLHKFEISEVNIKLRSFELNLNQAVLDIFCITTELNLIQTVGMFAIIQKDIDEIGCTNVVTVELTKDTTICKIQNPKAD